MVYTFYVNKAVLLIKERGETTQCHYLLAVGFGAGSLTALCLISHIC